MAGNHDGILTTPGCALRHKESEDVSYLENRNCAGDYTLLDGVHTPYEPAPAEPQYQNLDADKKQTTLSSLHRSGSSGQSLSGELNKSLIPETDEENKKVEDTVYDELSFQPEHDEEGQPRCLSTSKDPVPQETADDTHLTLGSADDEPLYEDPEKLDENARYYFYENKEILETGQSTMPGTWKDYEMIDQASAAYNKGVNRFQSEIRKQFGNGFKQADKNEMICLCHYLAISSFHQETSGHETVKGMKYLMYYEKLLKKQVEHYRLMVDFED